MLWISIQDTVQFSYNQNSRDQESSSPVTHEVNFWFCFWDLQFWWPGSFGSRWWGTPAWRHNKHSTGPEVQSLPTPSHWVLLAPLSQQAEKGLTVLGRVIDPDSWEETGLPLHKGGKEDYVQSAGDTSVCLSMQDGKRHTPFRNESMGHPSRKVKACWGAVWGWRKCRMGWKWRKS